MNRLHVYATILFCCATNIAEAVRQRTSPDFSPSAYSYRHPGSGSASDHREEIDLGTTLVAIKYSGGVVVGADTRTSSGGYVSNKFAYKINPIFQPDLEALEEDEPDDPDSNSSSSSSSLSSSSSSSCVLCRSGSAADTQWLANRAKQRFRMRKLERPGYNPSVSEVAHFLRYQMRNEGGGGDSSLQASLICAGYDAATRGGRIFGITPGGSLWEEGNFCVSGSGSAVLLGYLDDALHTAGRDFGSAHTEEEAVALVVKLLRLSIARDGSSGGLVRLYVINRKGLEERTVYPFADAGSGSGSGSDASSSTSADGAIGKRKFTDLEGFAEPSFR